MDPWTARCWRWPASRRSTPTRSATPNHRRNLGVAYTYEPGSTFKTFTASAVLQERLLTPESPINCAPGYILIGSRRVNDVHPYGVLSFSDVIVKSSNVGAIKGGLPRRRRADAALRAPVRLRVAPVAGPARRGDGHRLESAQRQRAGVGLDGLPDRRDAAADGYRRQLHRQRRSVDAAAPGARVLERQHAQGRGPGSDSPHRDAGDGRHDDRHHGRRRRPWHGKTVQIDGYTIAAETGTAAKLDGGRTSSRGTTRRSSGSFPRASRR